ncbi:MAG: SDR family NAD(P)-dependent oxidoreductase [Candidatus Omnitrophica bacterium]|nr:SDR family NAD(P)-dependent oxidoreductase [Candidatus Omnitrophota bacterium]
MKILITGGAGFIGINSAKRFIDEGHEVIIFDDLSRDGTERNLAWLKENEEFDFVQGDVKNSEQVNLFFSEHEGLDLVLHLAAQVAVTTSVEEPRNDFEVNALGTFNICEAVRRLQPEAMLLYSSTNKVYGEMTDIEVCEKGGRYEYKGLPHGISEDRSLDFHSPYGCSKGAGDQYVIDYGRIYDLKTVSFRQSCIYGPHQFGIEDQGWVAHFTISAVMDKPITIYGDGKQMRDVLHVDDLINCYLGAIQNIDKARGRAYNIGGGPENILFLMQLIAILGESLGRRIEYSFADWRPGDQKTFVCDTRRAKEDFTWAPKIGVQEGVSSLIKWVKENKELF